MAASVRSIPLSRIGAVQAAGEVRRDAQVVEITVVWPNGRGTW